MLRSKPPATLQGRRPNPGAPRQAINPGHP
jgi:hypothetical protein